MAIDLDVQALLDALETVYGLNPYNAADRNEET